MFRLRFQDRCAAILATLCILSAFWPSENLWAQSSPDPEIGGSAPIASAGLKLPKLSSLGSRLEITTQYTAFSGEDMEQIYGGLPLLAAGLSLQTDYGMRTFVALGYGRASGDPYQGRAGISAPNESHISLVPLQIGVRFDAANSERVHLNFTLALAMAWMRETAPPATAEQTDRVSASGVNSGYQILVGPEVMWGDGPSSIGLDFGWGGAKGTVRDDNIKHYLDLTGLQARLYVGLAL